MSKSSGCYERSRKLTDVFFRSSLGAKIGTINSQHHALVLLMTMSVTSSNQLDIWQCLFILNENSVLFDQYIPCRPKSNGELHIISFQLVLMNLLTIYFSLWWGTSDNEYINSSLPSAAYMHPWIGSALVKIMACRRLGTKPLLQPMLGYYQLDS